MAQLVLGAAGAVIGGFVGGPVGAQVGWALGSAIGGALAANQQKSTNTGPRLDTHQLTGSDYGLALGFGWGTFKTAGRLIDASEIRETEHRDSSRQGGKGGPKVTTVTYTYAADVAIALHDGEISGLRRVWIDGLLWADFSADSAQEALASKTQSTINVGNMTVYRGTEDQLPDPTFEALRGVGQVPAYRGIAYVVLQGLQVASERLPTFEFEIVRGADFERSILWHSAFPPSAVIARDASFGKLEPDRPVSAIVVQEESSLVRYFHFGQAEAGQSVTPAEVAIRTDGMAVGLSTSYYPWHVQGNYIGDLWALFTRSDTSPGAAQWLQIVGTTFIELDVFGDVFYAQRTIQVPANPGASSTYTFLGQGRLAYDADSDRFAFAINGFQGAGAGDFYLNKIHITGTTAASPAPGIDFAPWGTLVALYGHAGRFYVLAVSPSNRWRIAVLPSDGSTTSIELWDTGAPAFASSAEAQFRSNLSVSSAGQVYAYLSDTPSGSNDSIYEVSPAGWRLIGDARGRPPERTSAPQEPTSPALAHNPAAFWSDGERAMLASYKDTDTSKGYAESLTYLVSFVDLPAQTVTLSEIVTDLAGMAAVPGNWLDVTALDDQVQGYSSEQQTTARACIDQLSKIYWFDSFDDGTLLAFVKRQGISAETLPVEQLLKEGDATGLDLRRAQEDGLPQSMTLNYLVVGSYEVGTQTVRRFATPSTEKTTLSIPVVLDDQRGAHVADVLLWDAWTARTSYSFATDWSRMGWTPTDVVTLHAEGKDYQLRLLRKDIDPTGRIAWEAVAEDAPAYDPSAVGAPIINPPQVVAYLGTSVFLPVDAAPLLDGDYTRFGYYVAGGPKAATSSWPGMVVYESGDGSTWAEEAAVTEASTWGVTFSGLADWMPVQCASFDEANKLEVQLNAGQFESATAVDLLADQKLNLVMVGTELLQFRDATFSAGRWNLTGLIRGRFGTELECIGHAAAEYVVLVEYDKLSFVFQPLGLLNQGRLVKPVTIGRSLGQTTPEPHTNTGRIAKPLSVVHPAATLLTSGNITITWQRRNRIQGQWLNGVEVPMSEQVEAYSVDIMPLVGETPLRTLASSTPTLAYAAAQVLADYGSASPSQIRVRISQDSATVGRGVLLDVVLRPRPPVSSLVGWDPGAKAGNIVLSNGDKTATGNNNNVGAVKAKQSRASGKYYFEFSFPSLVVADPASYAVGSCDAATGTTGANIAAMGGDYGLYRGNAQHFDATAFTGSFTNYGPGDVIGVALDLTAGKGWYSKNGVLTTGDPVAGTGNVFAFTAATALMPYFWINAGNTNAATLSQLLSEFSYPPPTGYLPWNE